MRHSSRWIGGAAAAAAFTVILLAAAPAANAQGKKVKDQGEYDLYDASLKDIQANNWAKGATDLEAWKQKYPESDWKDIRDFYILRAYLANQQFDKALTFGGPFMDRDLPSMFKDKDEAGNVIGTYFIMVTAAAQLVTKDATPEQVAAGDKAAHKLLDYVPTYFTAANVPAGQTPAQFDQTKAQMVAVADGYLINEVVMPGQKAMAKKDCPAAESAYAKAVGAYPQRTAIAWQLAGAYNCNQKPFLALFEYARAVAIDPSLGKQNDPAKMSTFVKNTYVKLHGSADGYDQLLEQAKASTLPPADFKIKTADEIKQEQADAFAAANPEIAQWQNIKSNLVGQGAPFFESMKGAELPKLLAVIADAKPACRSKELTLYVPSPDNAAKTNEITLKFATALTGKPEAGSTIKFVAVADAFAPTPFMLTMTVEKEKVDDLKVTPCAAAPVRKGVGKKK